MEKENKGDLMNYKENGYYIRKGIVNTTTLAEIRNDIRTVFNSVTDDINDFDNDLKLLFKKDKIKFSATANICQYLTSFNKLTTEENIIDSLINEARIKLPLINTRPLLSFSHKDLASHDYYWKVPAHQDWHSMQGSLNAVTVWIPLVDSTVEIGTLEVIPGSHLRGELKLKDKTVMEDSEYEDKDFVPIELEAGDALFMSAFLIHKSGNNTTNQIRLSSHFRYDDVLENTFVERNFPHHRIDKRGEGILFPGFVTPDKIKEIFK